MRHKDRRPLENLIGRSGRTAHDTGNAERQLGNKDFVYVKHWDPPCAHLSAGSRRRKPCAGRRTDSNPIFEPATQKSPAMNTPNFVPGLLSGLVASTLSCGLFAQAGSLDSSFGGDGKVTADFLFDHNDAYSLALQPNGRIVTAGYVNNDTLSYDFAVMRHLSDGSIDSSFSSDGGQTTDFFSLLNEARAVAIQSDGKIVVVGYTYTPDMQVHFAIARYLADGTPDPTFSFDGRETIDIITSLHSEAGASSVVIQPDGKIVLAGATSNGPFDDFALVRLHTDGTLDNSFSFDGKVTTDFGISDDGIRSMAIQPDGRIVVAGSSHNGNNFDVAVARYHMDGSLDTGFDADGMVTTVVGAGESVARSVALQTDGKIVVACSSVSDSAYEFALVRYNTDGTLDTAFAGDGTATTDFGLGCEARSVVVQPDGKIVVAGGSSNGWDQDVAVARYDVDGTLDTDFAGDGTVTTDFGDNDEASSVVIQPDGRIVVAGWTFNGASYDFALARYISDPDVGLIDLSGPDQYALVYPNPIEDEATLQYVLSTEETISIRLLDLEGRVLHTFMENRVQGAGEHQQGIALPQGLASGAYVIVVSSLAGKVSIRVAR